MLTGRVQILFLFRYVLGKPGIYIFLAGVCVLNTFLKLYCDSGVFIL